MQNKTPHRELSQFSLDIFSKHETCIKKLISKLNYDIRTYFGEASDDEVAIKGFRSYYDAGLDSGSLSDNGLLEDVGALLLALQDGYKEQKRLVLQREAEARAARWRSKDPVPLPEKVNSPYQTVKITENKYDTQYSELNAEYVNQPFDNSNSLSFPRSGESILQADPGQENYFVPSLRGNEVTDFSVQALSNRSDNANDFIQQIDLFQQLVQSSLGSAFSDQAAFNKYIQQATADKDIFALLTAWLQEISDDETYENELKQSLSKALVTAYLLLDNPSLENDSTYIRLLGFLLGQTSINESLLLDTLKLQVKICLLANDDLDETNKFLDETNKFLVNFLGWKDVQGQEDVPELSEAFFTDLEQLIGDINSYQQDGVEFLGQFNGLNEVQSFFSSTFSDENEDQQQAQTKRYFAFVSSYTKDLLLVNKAVDLSLPKEATVNNGIDQVVVTTVSSLSADNLSEEERGKREFIAKLLQDAKGITAKTSGQSRQDLDQLFSLLTETYYPLEQNKSSRKAFRADLVKNAAQGLALNKVTLAEYLTSAQLNSQDKTPYVIMHYRFFLQVIKQYARKNTLEFVKVGNFTELSKLIQSIHAFSQKCAQSDVLIVQELAEQFQAQEVAVISTWFNGIQTPDAYAQSITTLAKTSLQLPQVSDAVATAVQPGSGLRKQLTTKDDYTKVIMSLLGALNKDTEAFVTQQILLLAKLDLDGKTLEVINAEKFGSSDKAELIRKLSTAIAIQNLPSFQLLIQLYPQAAQLFATPQFAPTMEIVTHLAMINQADIHSPLLQLVKVGLAEKEGELVSKILLIFMALKQPNQKDYKEMIRLLTEKGYQKTLENFSYIQLNSFADYHALLCQAAKTKANEMNLELIVKLFDLAITKAESAEELLSLALVCKDNKALAERLANTLVERFHQVKDLKTLMRRVNCTQAVAKIADAEIEKQHLALKFVTVKDYQQLITQASYPNGVESVIKSELVQKYFDLCQQSPSASDRAKYYSEFIHCLTDLQCLAWFIQSVLPQIVDKNLTSAAQCEKLLELIEKHIAPKVKLPELNTLLDNQRSIMSTYWLEQLVAGRDQLVLPKEILIKRQILNGDEQARDGREFVTLFDEAIKKIQQIQTPSLVELQQVNALFTKLLAATKEAEANISSQYAELEKNYQKDLEALIQNQQTFIQDLDKKLKDLTILRQQIEDKKGTVFATFESIKTELTKNEFTQLATNCQTYLDTVAKQFTDMREVTENQFEQLATEKDRQSADLQELTQLNEEKQLSPENMRMFCAKRQAFTETEKTTVRLSTEVKTQIEKTQQALFAQAIELKDAFGQKVAGLDQQHEQMSKQQTERQEQIATAQHRILQIPLILKQLDEDMIGIKANKQTAQKELERSKAELTRLREETLGTVSENIKKLSNTPEFKASLAELADVFDEAIEIRYVQQLNLWGRLRRAIAWVIIRFSDDNSWKAWADVEINSTIRKRHYLPFKVSVAEFVSSFYTAVEQCPKWVKDVMDDYNQHLPEIDTLRIQLNRLNDLIQRLNQPQPAGELQNQNQGTYASEIRDKVSKLFDVAKVKELLQARGSLVWQWSTGRTVDKFLADNDRLKVDLKTLSDTQATIDDLMVANKTLEDKITAFEQRLSPENFQNVADKLAEENSSLASQLIKLQEAQKTDAEILVCLKQQHGQLEPLYTQIISLVSSPLIEILYDKTGLSDERKLQLLQEGIANDKSSLLQEGMGANVVYHAVRQGTVEMLACILQALPKEDRRRYLATPIEATTPLVLAIKLNDQAKINCLIENGADLNQHVTNSNGNEAPLLLWAYQQDGVAVAVDCLIKAKAKADQRAKDSEGNTLLHLAAGKGDEALIKHLLGNNNDDAIVDVNAKNRNDDDALAILMKSSTSAEKKYQLMQTLFARLKTPTHLKAQYFTTVVDSAENNFLHLATAKGDLSLARWFLAQPDAELLNAKNKRGQTPLELAVQAGRLDMVQFLLHQPIKLVGAQEVFLAALKQTNTSKDMIEVFLTSHEVNLISDISAIFDGDVEFIAKKWTQEDQLQIKTSSYRYLTTCSNLESMKLLVDHGADPSATDDLGNTVLHDAVLRGDFARVQYLVEKCGIEPHPQNKAGMTPLMALYQKGKLPEGTHQQVVSYLVGKTSNHLTCLLPGYASETLTQTDKDGNTLLHYVVKVHYTLDDVAKVTKERDFTVEIANQLIQQKPRFGANPLNIRNNVGKTVAHVLAEHETMPEEVVTPLLKFLSTEGKANLHIVDKQGKTPLDYAQYLTAIECLIKTLPEPFQNVKLMPMAFQVMESEGMSPENKQRFIERIACANKMDIAQASYFYREVHDIYYKKDPSNGSLTLAGANPDAFSKNTYINSFNIKSEHEKCDQFRFMVNGQKAKEVACILDSKSPPPFPAELNQPSAPYLSLVDNTTLGEDPKNFWVRVVENREKKILTLQDYATGNTLLHALVWINDKGNLFRLNQTGVLYVTEQDHRNRTVLMLVREQFTQEVKSQPGYTAVPTKDQSVYLSILQSIERRLLVEPDITIVKQIVAELDFSQLTELEMLVSLFGRLRTANVNVENTAFLWQLTDRNGKSLAQSAIEVFNGLAMAKELSDEDKKLPTRELAEKHPDFVRCQNLLINLLEASQMEQHGQASVAGKLTACKQQMEDQIKYFIEQEKNNYIVSEGKLQVEVLNFGKKFSAATSNGGNILSSEYNDLCSKSAQLYKATDINQTNGVTQRFGGVFTKLAKEKEASLTLRQRQKNYAHNMAVYLGLFIEASGIDTLVTLPSRPDAPCSSLLKIAREQQLPSLYVEIVGRFLAQLGLTNPIKLVEQTQLEAAHKVVKLHQDKVEELQGATEPTPLVASVNHSGLRITVRR